MNNPTVTQEYLERCGFTSWGQLFYTVTTKMPMSDFRQIIKLYPKITFEELSSSTPVREVSVGEIAFRAMNELKKHLPDEEDFDTFLSMKNPMYFGGNVELYSKAKGLNDKLNKLVSFSKTK